jgi:cell division protein FtsB
VRPHRKFTIAGRRFEDVLRVERDRQIAELRAENAALKRRIEELEGGERRGEVSK